MDPEDAERTGDPEDAERTGYPGKERQITLGGCSNHTRRLESDKSFGCPSRDTPGKDQGAETVPEENSTPKTRGRPPSSLRPG